jgi:hypothetical protein
MHRELPDQERLPIVNAAFTCVCKDYPRRANPLSEAIQNGTTTGDSDT